MRSRAERVLPDLGWMLRHRATHGFLLACVALALAESSGTTVTWQGALARALSACVHVAMFVAPVVLALLWGSGVDADLETNRALSGMALGRQRVGAVTTAVIILAMGLLVTGAITFAGALAGMETPGAGEAPPVDLFRAAWHLLLTCVAVLVLLVVVSHGRESTRAVTGAVLIFACHLLVQFSAGLPGKSVWKEWWPLTGAYIIAESGRNYSPSQAAAAVVALAAWALVAGVRLAARPSRRVDRSNRAPARATAPAARAARLVLATVIFVTVTATVGPHAVRALPMDSRPSLLLQRADGQAPEQVVSKFFDRYQLGFTREAAAYVVLERRETFVEALPRYLARPSPGQSFTLERMWGVSRADVAAQIRAGRFHVCLTREARAWRITEIDLEPCPGS